MFRPEAVAHRERAAAPGSPEPLRIERWPVAAAYRGVLVLCAAAFAVLCMVPVDVRVRGRFERTGRVITATFPARYAGALGARLHLIDCGEAAIGSAEPGTDSVVSVHAALIDERCAAPAGIAEATIDTAPLIAQLFPRLRGLL